MAVHGGEVQRSLGGTIPRAIPRSQWSHPIRVSLAQLQQEPDARFVTMLAGAVQWGEGRPARGGAVRLLRSRAAMRLEHAMNSGQQQETVNTIISSGRTGLADLGRPGWPAR